ncbi:retropepsin-like aspartic protease [Sphingomonas sp.]|uniref:retropepsin-like aspartic protease family protein n=1 Tax=Sphingomonas sp. TaxID=28214 RepID=UPI001B24745B|nr:retropepsin-like aspartic protease [Sphingomonas sp.]MBO9714525.1 clan AA aspartic protease [Sphingomonas sp.]
MLHTSVVTAIAAAGFLAGTCVNSAMVTVQRPNANLAATNITPIETKFDEPKGAHREIVRSSDGLFYLDAKVNGEIVRFVVDTGASVVVLTGDDANRLGLDDKLGAEDRMRTAGGSAPMRWSKLDTIEAAGRQLSRIDVAVAGAELKVSLLGQNVLSQLGTVSFKGDKLVIN